MDVAELARKYDAVFIGVGAGLPIFLGVPGENLVGVEYYVVLLIKNIIYVGVYV